MNPELSQQNSQNASIFNIFLLGVTNRILQDFCSLCKIDISHKSIYRVLVDLQVIMLDSYVEIVKFPSGVSSYLTENIAYLNY